MEEFISLISHPEVAVLSHLHLPGGGGISSGYINNLPGVPQNYRYGHLKKKQQRKSMDIVLFFFKASL